MARRALARCGRQLGSHYEAMKESSKSTGLYADSHLNAAAFKLAIMCSRTRHVRKINYEGPALKYLVLFCKPVDPDGGVF